MAPFIVGALVEVPVSGVGEVGVFRFAQDDTQKQRLKQRRQQPQGQLPHLSRKKRGEDGAPETFLLNHLC